jgi:hypothetical protein
LLYDEIWTAEATEARAAAAPLPPDEAAGIRDLVEQMKRELDILSGPLYELRSMIAEAEPGTLEATLDDLVSSGVVPESVAAELRSGLQADLQDAFVEAADYILQNASNEAQALDDQLAALERGEPSYGDFGDKFWCAAATAFAGALVAGTIVIGGPVLGVGLIVGGTLGTTAAGLHFAKCFDKLPKFRFGFGH